MKRIISLHQHPTASPEAATGSNFALRVRKLPHAWSCGRTGLVVVAGGGAGAALVGVGCGAGSEGTRRRQPHSRQVVRRGLDARRFLRAPSRRPKPVPGAALEQTPPSLFQHHFQEVLDYCHPPPIRSATTICPVADAKRITPPRGSRRSRARRRPRREV